LSLKRAASGYADVAPETKARAKRGMDSLYGSSFVSSRGVFGGAGAADAAGARRFDAVRDPGNAFAHDSVAVAVCIHELPLLVVPIQLVLRRR
jgi:hypothetical protein